MDYDHLFDAGGEEEGEGGMEESRVDDGAVGGEDVGRGREGDGDGEVGEGLGARVEGCDGDRAYVSDSARLETKCEKTYQRSEYHQ